MARLARAVFAGLPHHVTQRGNGRAQTFFSDDDYRLYRDLLAEHAAADCGDSAFNSIRAPSPEWGLAARHQFANRVTAAA